MDFAELAARLEQSRRVTLRSGDMTFDAVLPTEHAMRVSFERHRNSDGVVMESEAIRELLEAAIKGWDGVNASVLLPDGGDDPLIFSAKALATLLDNRQDIADDLTLCLAAERKRRRDAIEAARKN